MCCQQKFLHIARYITALFFYCIVFACRSSQERQSLFDPNRVYQGKLRVTGLSVSQECAKIESITRKSWTRKLEPLIPPHARAAKKIEPLAMQMMQTALQDVFTETDDREAQSILCQLEEVEDTIRDLERLYHVSYKEQSMALCQYFKRRIQGKNQEREALRMQYQSRVDFLMYQRRTGKRLENGKNLQKRILSKKEKMIIDPWFGGYYQSEEDDATSNTRR